MPISTDTYEGLPGGMNLNLPAQSLDDTEGRYLQDILVDKPGLIRRRGVVKAIAGMAALPKPGSALFQTLDPLGRNRFAAIYGDNTTASLGLWSADGASLASVTWNGTAGTTPPTNPYLLADGKSSLTGGTWLGTSTRYDANSPVQTLALWRGGNLPDYTTGLISVSRGSTAVTGAGTAWATHATPGMFLFGSTDDGYTLTYMGVVKTVNSDTSITLGAVSPYPATGQAFKLTSIRGWCDRIVTGRVTTNTGSTAVTGAATKFLTQGMGTGTWNLYRASDFMWIGKISSVTNDTNAVLAANATNAMNNARYIALQADGDYSINTLAVADRKMGFVTSQYSSRQWFANNGQQFDYTTRVYFSDPSDPEAVDLSPFDGDFIPIASSSGVNTPIKQLMPAYNALMVFKDTETFGIFGNTPTTFQAKKIEDDGTLSGMSVQPYGGGVIWAGRSGVHFYDGIQASNLTQTSLGDYYKTAVRSFDPNKYRMWSMLNRDHYFLFMENATPNVAVIKGTVSTTPNKMVLCINMITKAITMLTNISIRGSLVLPADTGETTWYLVNSTTNGYVCDGADLFDTDGIDSIACDGGALGPSFYLESKKYKEGDSLRKKLYKQIIMEYIVQNGALKVDTVVGLNNMGTTLTSQFPATVYTWTQVPSIGSTATWASLSGTFPTWNSLIQSVFKPKRLKFLKRNQHMAFRIYQADDSSTKVTIGPFQIGYKLQRQGRV